MAPGAVLPSADEQRGEQQHDEGDRDDREGLDPPRHRGGVTGLRWRIRSLACGLLGHRISLGVGCFARHYVVYTALCLPAGVAYPSSVPRLWSETIETHRRDVRDAILDATAAQVAEHGLRAVTMAEIAQTAGIGRATLYKYFPSVDAILMAWHERQVAAHVEQLSAIALGPGGALERLTAVLRAYAVIGHHRHRGEIAALVHQGHHVDHAQHRLARLLEELLSEAVADGDARSDVPPAELATFCLHALAAAGELRSKAAVRRLVSVTVAGLRSGKR